MRQYVIFSSNDQHFALEISNIDKIIQYKEPKVIPESSKFFIGVIQYNGKVLPVIDLTTRLYNIQLNRSEDNSIIVLLWQDREIGLLVDDVIGIKSYEENQIEESKNPNDYIQGFIKEEDNIIMVIDGEYLLTHEQEEKIISSIEEEDGRGEM